MLRLPPVGCDAGARDARLGRWVYCGLGALALAVLVLVVQIRGAWGEAVTRVGLVQARLEAMPTARPVLRAQGRSGDAWPAYERAMREVERFGDIGALLHRAAGGDLPTPLRALLVAAAPAFAELRAGTESQEACLRLDFRLGAGMPCPDVQSLLTLGRFACAAAAVAVSDGDAPAALLLWLDALQLGRDIAGVPLVVFGELADVLVEQLVEQWSHPEWLDRLGASGRAELARALRIVVADWPRGNGLAGEVLGLVRALEASPTAWSQVRWPGWRYAGSPRLLCARHVLLGCELADALRGQDLAALEQLHAAWLAAEPPLTLVSAGGRTSLDPALQPRATVARLHAALAALRWFDGEDPSEDLALAARLQRRIGVAAQGPAATFSSLGVLPESVSVSLSRSAASPARAR